MYLNRLSIMGFLGADGEKKSTASGQTYTVLSVATKTSWKDGQGEWQSNTEWHRVIVWGDQFAEYAAGLKKGAHVLVEGGLRSREYQKDGVKHRVFECKADSILKLDRTGREPNADGEPVSKEVLVGKRWMLATTMLAIRTMSDGESLVYDVARQLSRERGVAASRTP